MLTAQLSFAILTLLCFFLLDHYFFGKHLKIEGRKRYRLIFHSSVILWLIITGLLSYSGFFENFETTPPRFLILILVPLLSLIFLLTRGGFSKYVRAIPMHHILGLQSFRIIVEILLWYLYELNAIPIQMTFEEYNLDVLTGVTAPIVAFMVFSNRNRFRVAAIIWNILGMLLLINIVSIAILSTPLFNFFPERIPNTIVAGFPFVYLPAFLVPMAYYLHFISFIQLTGSKRSEK